MHPPAPAPVSSDLAITTGVAIPQDAVPVRTHRRVHDRGAHMMEMLHKRTEDTLDYCVDLTRWLEPGETVTGARAYALPQDLKIPRLQYAPRAVVVWLSEGCDGGRHTVFCQFTTSLGKVKLIRFVVITRGRLMAVAEVSIDPAPSFTFPDTMVGLTSAFQSFALHNLTDAQVDLLAIMASAGFVQTNDCGSALAAGASCTISVAFAPGATGHLAGTLLVQTAGGSPVTVTLSGNGINGAPSVSIGDGVLVIDGVEVSIGDAILVIDGVSISIGDGVLVTDAPAASLAFSPAALAFPSTAAGEQTVLTVTITNDGDLPVTINGFTSTGAGFSAEVIP